jgi:hypothetical protein
VFYLLFILDDNTLEEIRVGEELVPFKKAKPGVASCTEKNGVITTVLQGYTHLLSMLVECGQHSSQPYVAFSNHRQINYKNLNEGHSNTQIPLTHAMVAPEKYSASFSPTFDNKDHISFMMHGLRSWGGDEPDKDDDHNVFLKSPSVMVANDCPGGIVNGPGCIKGKSVQYLNGVQFKRTLLVFGMKWVDDNDDEIPDDAEPTIEDQLALLLMLGEWSLQTKNGFNRMLKKFNMQSFFKYDDDHSIGDNRFRFGRLIRSLAPLRLTVFEGQHRFHLLVLWLCGFYKPSPMLALKKIKLPDALPELVSDDNIDEVRAANSLPDRLSVTCYLTTV